MPQNSLLLKQVIKGAIQFAYARANPPRPATATTTFGDDGQPVTTPGPSVPAALDDKLVDAIAEGVATAVGPWLLPPLPS